MSIHKNHSVMRICSSHEMRTIDEIADQEYGIDAQLLMENAGRSASQILLEEYPDAGRATEILVFAGKGNNAGDAFVLARRLISLERRVRVFHVESPKNYRAATLKNFEILKKMKAKLVQLDAITDLEAFLKTSTGPFTVVDGILGTGLKGQLEGLFYDLVEMINGMGAREVVSLDIPTGVSGDSGQILGTSIHANLTVSFGFPKLGHFLAPGAGRRGSLINSDISLPARFRREGSQFLLLRDHMARLLAERDRYGHKNSFGHTLLVGGSPGRLGAIIMAAQACHKMGTGLVTVATWKDSFEALLSRMPLETMAIPIELEGESLEFYKKNLHQYSCVVVGPGLGTRKESKVLLTELLQNYRGPVVLDADALNLVGDHKLHDLLQARRSPTVLTPHPGEMARLLGIEKDAVVSDPTAAVKTAVAKTHAVVLLKGAATLVGSPDEVTYLNYYPNDGMATAGSGDVLSGMIGGLLGQKMAPFDGTRLGVYLHSLAGDLAAMTQGHRSMTAPDIINSIGAAFREIKKDQPKESLPLEVRARLL